MESKRSGGFLNGMQWVLDKSDRFMINLTGFVLVFMTLMIVVDVALRVLFNSPLPASAESVELMMPYIAFCALAYTLAIGAHVRISILVEKLPVKYRPYLEWLVSLVGLGFCALLTYVSWTFFWESFVINEEMLAIIKLPWWVGKFAMPLGFFVMTLRYLFNLVAVMAGRVDVVR
jgi:TRAP-type C4-dicarboxylate transport system permease small subunit